MNLDAYTKKHRNNIQSGVYLSDDSDFERLKKSFAGLGNKRWSLELIVSTWYQASQGKPPRDWEYKTGLSRGGFDAIEFAFPYTLEDEVVSQDSIDLSIDLNKRSTGQKISIPLPTYGAGMSYGSVSLATMLSRVKAAKQLGTFSSTGEGGYPEELLPYKEHVITQVATGMFGVTENTIKHSCIVELKYAQGAKPGLGGHLLSPKVTESVAKMRGSVKGVSLYSPFPFHSVYSVEDHKSHLEWIKTINPSAPVSVKVSTPSDIDMVAVGSYYAGANIINLDGAYGATGAAPEIAKKNIAMPLEYAINKTHTYLVKEGVRDEVVLMASGGIRTAYDVAKAIALGADGCVIGSAELIPLACTQCGNCESGRGCQVGIATTDPDLSRLIDNEWGAKRIVNMYDSWKIQWKEILAQLGMKRITELRGRKDLLKKRGVPA